MKAGNYRSQI